MAEITRVEARPANQPTVKHFKGYEYLTWPLQAVRIRFHLTLEEKEAHLEYMRRRPGSHPPYGAARTEWDRGGDPDLQHLFVTYPIQGNPFKVTDPHRIAESARREIVRFTKERRL